MMLQVISRTVGLHRLILLTLYPYLQRYVQVYVFFFFFFWHLEFGFLNLDKRIYLYFQPHQRDVTSLLAAAVQACHDMVCFLAVS